MSRSLNHVQLIGNLGADPETRAMPSGMTATNIRVATSEEWKDKESGEKKERTEWTTVTFFGKLAEIAHEYLKKGSKVYISGSLRTRKWQDKTGADRYSTEVVADELIMLDGRQSQEQPEQQQRRPARQQRQPDPVEQDGGEFDDSIPF